MKSQAEIRAKFRRLVEAAVREGLSALAELPPETLARLPRDTTWPILKTRDSGFPSFQDRIWGDTAGAPIDYVSAFGPMSGPIGRERVPSVAVFFAFAREQPTIVNRLFDFRRELVGQIKELDDPIVEFVIGNVPLKTLNRYMQLHKTPEFDADLFDSVYCPWEEFFFAEQLRYAVAVPILFVHFPPGTHTIGEHARIEEMSADFQIARSSIKHYGSGVTEQVASCATHMLVLEGHSVSATDREFFSNLWLDPSVFPLERIDQFFCALRAVAGVDTGYAQLLVLPEGWTRNYRAHLPPMEGTAVRSYPSWFDRYYWNRTDHSTVEQPKIEALADAFKRLITAKDRSVQLAARRINRCFLRDTDEDAILDATIGLEALLSDGQTGELTHKLALRVAALWKFGAKSPPISASDVFSHIKAVYKHRSIIVHGVGDPAKQEKIRFPDGTENTPLQLGLSYLRFVFLQLLRHQELRNATTIDKRLLQLPEGSDVGATRKKDPLT